MKYFVWNNCRMYAIFRHTDKWVFAVLDFVSWLFQGRSLFIIKDHYPIRIGTNCICLCFISILLLILSELSNFWELCPLGPNQSFALDPLRPSRHQLYTLPPFRNSHLLITICLFATLNHEHREFHLYEKRWTEFLLILLEFCPLIVIKMRLCRYERHCASMSLRFVNKVLYYINF